MSPNKMLTQLKFLVGMFALVTLASWLNAIHTQRLTSVLSPS
jgi:hypothetical protein